MSTVANIYSTRLWSPNICRALASERADIGWLPPGWQRAGVGSALDAVHWRIPALLPSLVKGGAWGEDVVAEGQDSRPGLVVEGGSVGVLLGGWGDWGEEAVGVNRVELV